MTQDTKQVVDHVNSLIDAHNTAWLADRNRRDDNRYPDIELGVNDYAIMRQFVIDAVRARYGGDIDLNDNDIIYRGCHIRKKD